MSNAFVGVTPNPVDKTTLQDIINRCIDSNGWQFLRWPHQVKLSPVSDTTDFSACQEGQAFDQDRELRWKRQGQTYEVLLLSESGGDKALLSINNGQSWETKILDAKPYQKTETRFPRKIEMPDGLDLGQRYFINAQTACVQFIALRVK
ncbi:MAG: hypothetical protein AAGF01_11910 [Cyanobacteria bacterium P01_G01_bin.38]